MSEATDQAVTKVADAAVTVADAVASTAEKIPMDDIQSKLASYLNSVENGVENLIDFSSDQIPLLVQEVVTYHIILGLAYAIAQIMAGLIFGVSGYSIWKYMKNNNVNADGFEWLALTVGLILNMVLFCASLPNWLYVGKAYFAPRLFMLEYIQSLIN